MRPSDISTRLQIRNGKPFNAVFLQETDKGQTHVPVYVESVRWVDNHYEVAVLLRGNSHWRTAENTVRAHRIHMPRRK